MSNKKRAMLFSLLCCAARIGALSSFYWEQPDFFSPDGGSPAGSFPVTAFNGSIAVLAWQEAAPRPAGGTAG
jgi:hypothetical protein